MPFVLDISSDEEPCLEEGEGLMKDHEWIKECLDMPDEKSLEVVVLSEVKKPEPKSKSSISMPADDDDDDDDCLILDGDPENLVTSVEEAPAGSDELLVVGVKGQVLGFVHFVV